MECAQKFYGGEHIDSKSYKYDKDGVLTEICKSFFDKDKNATCITLIYRHDPFYIKEKGLNVRFTNSNGNKFIQDVKTGKILQNNGKFYFYNPDGSLKCTKDATPVLPNREELLSGL